MNDKYTIVYPITLPEIEATASLVEENLFKQKALIEELKNTSVGELLAAKDNAGEIIGMLSMRHPGKIFQEIGDEYFDLNSIDFEKDDLGYIALVVVKKSHQGQGIGKLLVKRAINLQKEWGSKAIIVHASESSPGQASKRLFSSFGFKPTKLHIAPWHDYSAEKGPEEFWCNFCGNPCKCNELEMIKEL